MTDSEKIEFLGGQMHALLAFATAVILTHPDPAELTRQLEKAAETNLALAESKMVSEDYLDGVLDVRKRLAGLAEMALRRKETPPT